MSTIDKENLINNIKIITDKLYEGDVESGISDIGVIVPVLIAFSDGIDDEAKSDRLLNDILVPTLAAMEEKDGITIADILQYELIPFIEEE